MKHTSLAAQSCPAMRNRPGHPEAARPAIARLKRPLFPEVRTSPVPVRQRRAQLGAILQRPTLSLGVACRFDDTPPVVDAGNAAIESVPSTYGMGSTPYPSVEFSPVIGVREVKVTDGHQLLAGSRCRLSWTERSHRKRDCHSKAAHDAGKKRQVSKHDIYLRLPEIGRREMRRDKLHRRHKRPETSLRLQSPAQTH